MADELTLVGKPVAKGESVQVVYANAVWEVTIRAHMYAVVDGPVELTIKMREDTGLMDDPSHAEGITTALLRAIPMRKVRNALSAAMVDAYKIENVELPERFQTDFDYAQLAALYVERVKVKDPNPIHSIAKHSNVKRSTLAARIRTARAKGLLPPEGERPKLTPVAEKLLGVTNG